MRRQGSSPWISALSLSVPIIFQLASAAMSQTTGSEKDDKEKGRERPTLTLASDTVRMDGVTVGGATMVIGVTRSFEGAMPVVREYEEVLHDDDDDGSVELIIEEGVKARSLWLAVDLVDGTVLFDTPDKKKAKEIPFKVENLERSASGRLERLISEIELALLYVVRPPEKTEEEEPTGGGGDSEDGEADEGDEGGGDEGEGDPDSEDPAEPKEPAGIWRLRAGNGGLGDADGESDEKLTVYLPDFIGVAETLEPLEELLRGDVLVAIDLATLDHYVVALK